MKELVRKVATHAAIPTIAIGSAASIAGCQQEQQARTGAGVPGQVAKNVGNDIGNGLVYGFHCAVPGLARELSGLEHNTQVQILRKMQDSAKCLGVKAVPLVPYSGSLKEGSNKATEDFGHEMDFGNVAFIPDGPAQYEILQNLEGDWSKQQMLMDPATNRGRFQTVIVTSQGSKLSDCDFNPKVKSVDCSPAKSSGQPQAAGMSRTTPTADKISILPVQAVIKGTDAANSAIIPLFTRGSASA